MYLVVAILFGAVILALGLYQYIFSHSTAGTHSSMSNEDSAKSDGLVQLLLELGQHIDLNMLMLITAGLLVSIAIGNAFIRE